MIPKPLLPIRRPLAALLALALAGATGSVSAQALTPAFTYQGELRLSSGPATGSFDMQFLLYGAVSGGAQIGSTITASNVSVTGGLFAVPLDFGVAQFAGERQWLEIRIRPAGSGSFETLSPRTEVTAAPYAWSAAVALANSVTTTSIVDGTIGSADINPAQVQRRVNTACQAFEAVRAINEDGTLMCNEIGTGSVSLVQTGIGLTGGPIVTNGTISVAPGGIGTVELADGGIKAIDVDPAQVQRRVIGTCTGTNYVQQVNADGTVGCGPAPVANAWSLTGNAGTNPTTNLIGTTDARAFVVRTANARSLRIEPSTITSGTPSLPITTNMISGSHANSVVGGVRGATIGGGGVPGGDSDPDFSMEAPNRVTDHYGTVGGGYANVAGDDLGTLADAYAATVGGGWRNSASGDRSTVAGGASNSARGSRSSIGGGGDNIAEAGWASVAGGQFNSATGRWSSVGGGSGNTASGDFAAVGGGASNCAGGRHSWAGGFRAKVRPGSGSGPAFTGCLAVASSSSADGDQGTFAWADSQATDLVSTGSNQFLVRAQGGIYLGTNSTVSIPAGRFINTSTGAHLTTGGAWTNASSRTFKADFAAVDPADVLGRVLRLGITTWAYRDSEEGRHMGPIAEEFHALFGLGGDDHSISTVDIDGVALAAIQGLNAKLEAENAALRAESAQLRARVERLEGLVVGRIGEER